MDTNRPPSHPVAKRPYSAPRLQRYGQITDLTLSVGMSGADGSKNPSQMRFGTSQGKG